MNLQILAGQMMENALKEYYLEVKNQDFPTNDHFYEIKEEELEKLLADSSWKYEKDRVENLERVTSLSLLELNTQTLQIRDADGRNRFKSGFFVDDFKNYSLIDRPLSSIQINPTAEELIPIISRNSLKSQIALTENIIPQSLDFTDNADLLDPNIQKTGDSITLAYDEIDWIEQPIATTTENVNPFNVVVYTGNIELNPAVDTWVRTIQLPDRSIRTSTNRSRTLTQNLTSSINLNLGTAQILSLIHI